jgi:hypothetical protein
MAKRKANVGDRVEFYMGREDGWHSGTVRNVLVIRGVGAGGEARREVYYQCDDGDPADRRLCSNGYKMWAEVPARYIRKKETA